MVFRKVTVTHSRFYLHEQDTNLVISFGLGFGEWAMLSFSCMDHVSTNPGRYLAGVFTLRILYFYMHVVGLLFGSQQLDICNIFF
jgi:hypothetical protein